MLLVGNLQGFLATYAGAIVLVTPGNPSGVTIPPAEIAAFAAPARRRDIALVLDETYRSFRDTQAPAHPLFADPAWRSTLVSLHSYSKELAIPGYRVGCCGSAPGGSTSPLPRRSPGD